MDFHIERSIHFMVDFSHSDVFALVLVLMRKYGFTQAHALEIVQDVPGVKKKYIINKERFQAILSLYDIPKTKLRTLPNTSKPPSTKEIVRSLNKLGFTHKFIQSILNIGQSTVSYHIHSTPKSEYKTSAIIDIQR